MFRWRGDGVEVSWDEALCLHAAECTRAKGGVFEAGRKPWCEPRGVPDEAVRDIVGRCPSGALAARFDAPGTDEPPPAENTVHVAEDGPLYAHGELAIGGAPERAPGLARRAALCRCGHSGNKPYCDGSHRRAGFRDGGAVGDPGEPLAAHGGPLEIEVRADGPLRVRGNLVLTAGGGRRAWQGAQTALCRCGLSGNKPFCDGTHRREGWTDGARADGADA